MALFYNLPFASPDVQDVKMSTSSMAHGLGIGAIHAGQSPDPCTGAVMTPIYATSIYVQRSPDKGGMKKVRRRLERCKLFALAESLGGVESLIEHPALMLHALVPAANRKRLGIRSGRVRLSAGVEDIADLRDELATVLA